MKLLSIIKFDEISLKEKNQCLFVNKLVQTLHHKLGPNVDFIIVRRRLFLVVKCSNKEAWNEIKKTLSQTFGIAKFYNVFEFPERLDSIKIFLLSFFEEKFHASFRILTKRFDKTFPKTSWEIDDIFGKIIHAHFGIPVILKTPELTIYIEITTGKKFVLSKTIGTFSSSIEPDQDYCSLFMPKRPVLFAKTEDGCNLESSLPIKKNFNETLSKIENLVIS